VGVAMKRHVVLPSRGELIVSTDLHGNGEDFRQLRETFLARPGDTHWVQLGDIVHAPSEEARRDKPALYDYPDESGAIARGFVALMEEYPERVHFVLGNHDYGHIGRPHTSKFYADEVAHLEGLLDDDERAALQRLCGSALLAVVAPCGAFLSHGAPDDRLEALADLDRIALPHDPDDAYLANVLQSLLTSYGQPREVCARFLEKVSRAGNKVTMVIHGHDRDDRGFFVEHDNQICPCIFGAPRGNKRYLLLDLGTRYEDARGLREGREILRLY